MRTLSRSLILGNAIFLLAWNLGSAFVAGVLPPCPTEDTTATNCTWDAQSRGNGQGDSFFVIDGTAYYMPSK